MKIISEILGKHGVLVNDGWDEDTSALVADLESHLQTQVERAERKGYDNALDQILEWGSNWQDTHDTPFNWHGAAKALKISKDMQLPYIVLPTNYSGEQESKPKEAK